MDDAVREQDRGGLASTIFAAVFALIIGAATGFVLTFVHHEFAPWALVVGLVIVAALVAGFRLVFDSRLIAAAAGLGVLLATALLALPAVSGTALLLDDPIGYVWAIAPTVITVGVVLWPSAHRPSTRRNRMVT